MFNEATTSLPFGNSDTHALVVRRFGRLVRLYSFANYDLALAAYENTIAWYVATGQDENDARALFAVRSMDDPNVLVTGEASARGYVPYTIIAAAVSRFIREEEKATVRAMLRSARDGDSFEGLVRAAHDSLTKRGYRPERWAIRDALKPYVTLGRCTCGGRNVKRGYFFKKGAARLYDTRCPRGGERLAQTSLALHGTFSFISNPKEA